MIRNTHTLLMDAAQPEIERVVLAAKDLKDEHLESGDFAVVVDRSDVLAERATQALHTRTEWEALRSIINREQAEHADVAADGAEKLTMIHQAIDASIAKGDSVTDLEPPRDPSKPSALLDRIKGLSIVGTVVRSLIALQRALIDMHILSGDKAQLDMIESMYARWFGAAEVREQVGALLEKSGIAIGKGTNDHVAYTRLQSDYMNALTAKLARTGADGTPVVISPAEQNAIKTSFPFSRYLATIVQSYTVKHGAPDAGPMKRVTTLMGIVTDATPTERRS